MRIDNRQWLIEQNRRNVLPHEATPHGDLLLLIRGQILRLLVELVLDFQDFGDLMNAGFDLGRGHLVVLEGKRQVVVDSHGVVNDRKLKNLGNVPVSWGQLVNPLAVEQDIPLGGLNQAGNNVQHGAFPATGRPQQCVRPTLVPDVVELTDGVIIRPFRPVTVTVGK